MDTRKRLPPADAAWLHMDRPTNLMVITGALWFDEPQDWDRVREVFRTRVVDRYPRFRSRIVEAPLGLGRCRFEELSPLDLEPQLHHVRLDPPGDMTALQALVGRAMGTPLDRRRPLWENYLVDGLDGGSAIVVRLHHCLADGITLARVLLSLTDDEPDAGLDLSTPAPDPAVEPRPSERLAALATRLSQAGRAAGRELSAAAREPARASRDLALGVAGTRSLGKLVFLPPDHRSVLKGRMGVRKRAVWTRALPLDEVKAIGHGLGATLNDVALTAVAGALHRYLDLRDSVVSDLRAIVPFNLRRLDQPIPRDLGNRFGLVFLSLPVGIAEPVDRLWELKRRMDAIKASPEGPVSFGVLSAVGVLPASAEAPVVEFFTSKASAVMTNVPGPRQPVYLAGRRVRGMMAWVPSSGHIGLGVSIISYDGSLRIGIATDARLVPDPEVVVHGIDEELEVLREAAGVARPSAAPAQATVG